MPTWWRCWSKTAEDKKTSITILDLSHQSLIDVPNDVFSHERTLEELHLNSNRIYDLPRQLFLCLGLKILNVCDNDLTRIPNAIQDLKNLSTLDLSKNAITIIPDLNQLQHLNILNLSLNPLDRIPDTIYNTSTLTELYLNDTNLTYIVANIGKLVNLSIFEIRENKLTSLPESICRLKKLTRLDVGQNELTNLPSSFGQLSSLTELSLDLNYLECLPESLAKLSHLIHLDVSFNNVTNLDNDNEENQEINEEISQTTKLKKQKQKIESVQNKDVNKSAIQTLYLNNNNLNYLPMLVFNMCNLVTLRVEGNFLTTISPQIGRLLNLEELCLNSNNLTSMPGTLGLLKKLKVLMLDDNLLECLPKELSSCEDLSILSVRNNKLTHLISDLGHLSKLSVLNVANNRLRHLPVTILLLDKIKAIWLSATQSKPLVPLQREHYGDEVVLTCVLLPQIDTTPTMAANIDKSDKKEAENFTVLSTPSKHINFALDATGDTVKEPSSQKQSLKLNRSPTPYPKQLKQMAKNLKAGSKSSSSSEIKEARIITSLESSNLDKFDSFVVYEQNVVIRQAKNTKSTDLLEKNYDGTDVESTSNCYNTNFYGDMNRDLTPVISTETVGNYNNEEANNFFVREPSVHQGLQEQMFNHEDAQDHVVLEQSVPEQLIENQREMLYGQDMQQNSYQQFNDVTNENSMRRFDEQSNISQEDAIDGYPSNTNQIFDNSPNLVNGSNDLYVEDNRNLYANRMCIPQPDQIHTQNFPSNENYIYNDYQRPAENKPVPPPYHIARNYSKHAKYYDVLHSKIDNTKNNEYNDYPLLEQTNSDSPISITRSQIETPISNVEDDRHSIKNFVDNQTQRPYVIKPKAHKLTTEHGDYHFLIQNKFSDEVENNANIPEDTTNDFNHQNINTQSATNINDKFIKPKSTWMFGQHKNVKVVNCNIYNIDFNIEHGKDQGLYVKTCDVNSALQVGDKLLQIGEESVCQLLSNIKETENSLSKIMLLLNQIPRPFQVLVSRQS
ncbi:protein lap1-like [Ctenocephalides felis]|uniref:protein lap1-like n=1 Tax=Ctenocephalides felis TaxID=7515 RepID=UPI000E6E58D9|nr:protein lap1-like [Ctenocephalides felis]